MSRVRRFGSLVSFDGKWFIATCNLFTWASSSCVSQQLFCLLALLEFTHSFLVNSARVVRITNDFALGAKFDLLISFEFQAKVTNSTRTGYLNVLEAIIWECLFEVGCPMWEDSRSIYIGVTAASPFKCFITRFRTTLLVHMRSEQR